MTVDCGGLLQVCLHSSGSTILPSVTLSCSVGIAQAVSCRTGGVGDPPRKPLELWVAEVASGAAKCLLPSPEWGLNGVFDE